MNTTWLIPIGSGAIVALCVMLSGPWFGMQNRVRRRIKSALWKSGGAAGTSQLFVGSEFTSGSKERICARLRQFLEQAGVSISVGRLLSLTLATTAAATLVAARLHLHLIVMVAVAVAGIASPLIYVTWRRRRRVHALRRQLSDAFDVMVRAIQSGQTVPAAIQLVASECPPLIAREFALCCDQQNLGITFEAALRNLARRIPVVELHILVVALIVQRQCGGNPVEMLTNLSDLIRKRLRLGQRIRALTGEGRMQAVVLTALPVVAFVALLLTRPDYVGALIARPRWLAAVGVADVIGCLWIRRIIQVQF